MRWPAWLYRLVPYLGRRAAQRDLEEELRLHLELERESRRDAGVPEDEALRAARRTLGNAALIRERTRDVWGWRWLDDLGRDVRHAVRALARSPGFRGDGGARSRAGHRRERRDVQRRLRHADPAVAVSGRGRHRAHHRVVRATIRLVRHKRLAGGDRGGGRVVRADRRLPAGHLRVGGSGGRGHAARRAGVSRDVSRCCGRRPTSGGCSPRGRPGRGRTASCC